LRRSAETGETVSRSAGSPAAATPVKADSVFSEGRKTISGGEAPKSVAVPRVQKIRTGVTADSTEVVIDLEDSVQFASGRIANPDRIYFDLHAARLSPAVASTDIHVNGKLLTRVRVAQNKAGVVRVVMDVNGVREYAVSLTKKPTRLVIELYASTNPAKADGTESAKVAKSSPGSRVSASASS